VKAMVEKRCYNCVHYKPNKRGFSGKCLDTKPSIKVDAVDFCDYFKEKVDSSNQGEKGGDIMQEIYLIYHHNYDDCNHIGYCESEEEAEKICEQLNIKINTHTWSNIHLPEKLNKLIYNSLSEKVKEKKENV
jgi:ABC-type Zn uptake system ZnuABC Zn-binding protein ZnuA